MSSSALAASDHLSKVNAFVSTAGNFIDSALDQLDDQLESAMGGMSEKVGEELKEYSLTAEAMETAKAASSAWSSLGFAALRDEWRDAATEISQKQKDAKSAGRDLAEAARASRRDGAGDAENKALLKAMGSEIKRLTERVNLAETAFFSMLNDLDEAPDPSEPLARTTKAAEYVTGAGALRNDLDATKAELAAVKDAALSGANSEAARELRELKETISDQSGRGGEGAHRGRGQENGRDGDRARDHARATRRPGTHAVGAQVTTRRDAERALRTPRG
jgi:hypothetical protein